MRIIIAGGGTGGHLFPGIAIAEEFRRRNGATRVLFMGTERGLEKRILPQMGYPLETIQVEGIKGKGVWRGLGALIKLPVSLIQSFRIIRGFGPQIVIGVGGYASGPAVLAAHWMGIKTAIAEQNAIPGATNKWLGGVADRIFVSFAESREWFPAGKTVVTGNPIRRFEKNTAPRDRSQFRLLVFGGSQGAHRINEAMLAALPYLTGIKERLQITHQTGDRDIETVKKGYGEFAMDASVLPFITDMAGAYSRADLLVCRAGATSIAEITAFGKASIFIPFPFAVNDHQTKNAEVLVKAGAAQMITERELSGNVLAERILVLFNQPELIGKMEDASAALGNPRAAEKIYEECRSLAAGAE